MTKFAAFLIEIAKLAGKKLNTAEWVGIVGSEEPTLVFRRIHSFRKISWINRPLTYFVTI